jgi:Carboxypeptidase regulatory-like domain/Tetratricopeptide repeat
MRHASSFACLLAFLLCSCVVCFAPLAAPVDAQQRTPSPQPSPPAADTPLTGNFTLNGMVMDADSHARLDYVKLELHATNGAIVGTVFTSSNGTFEFSNINQGEYNIFADLAGYQTTTEPVEVINSSLFGIQVELAKDDDPNQPVSKGPSAVSVRELSIPRKAHDDMEKGVELLYQKSDYPGSLKAFEKAIQEYADYYEAYTQMGVAYMKLTDNVNAEKAFRKSMDVSHEQYVDAYFGLAELFLNGHRFGDAEPIARKAVELDSNSWQAQSELARALVGLHRPSEAETSAVSAVKLKPDDAMIYLVLANIHIELQKNDALLEDLNQYLKLAPYGSYAEQARVERDKIQQALALSPTAPAASSSSQR